MIDEVKPSFTMRYFLLQVLVGIVTVSLGIVGTLLVTRSSVKENTIDVSSMSSQNLPRCQKEQSVSLRYI